MLKYVLGIDIGGTKTLVGLVDIENGKVVKKKKISTPQNSYDGIIQIVEAIYELSEGKKYDIGIACAGQIDIKNGIVVYSPNMPEWRNTKVVEMLGQKLGWRQKIKIENDSNCFALAEWKFGAGRDCQNIIGLTLGTGVGSGAVLSGKFFHGQGNAPELGHMILEISGKRCACGKIGHLEAYSSGRAIENRYFEITGQKLSATDIEEKIAAGDSAAKEIFDIAKKYLAIGIANIIASFDPEIIILGGGIGMKSELIYQDLEEMVQEKMFFKDKKVKIVKAQLEDAGLIGAALLVVDNQL